MVRRGSVGCGLAGKVRWVKVRFGLARSDEVWSGRYGMVGLCLVLEVGLGLAGLVG